MNRPIKYYGHTSLLPINKKFLFIVVGIALSVAIRLFLSDFISGDLGGFLFSWFDKLSQSGMAAFKQPFSDYPPGFLYGLFLSTKLYPGVIASKALSIKLISFAGDYTGAYLIYQILKLYAPQGLRPTVGSLVFLFAPTVVFNSAVWGQCDILFTTAMLFFLYYVLKGEGRAAMIAYAIGCSLKLQSLFLFPLVFVLLRLKICRWRDLLWPPAIFFLFFTPALIAGSPFREIWHIYFHQIETYESLTLGAATLYQWFPDNRFQLFFVPGILGCLFAVCLYIFLIEERHENGTLQPVELLRYAVLASILFPFLLPKMHDRYFYLADVLTLLYAFVVPRRAYIALLMTAASFFSYLPFLFGKTIIPAPYLSFLPLIAIYVLGKDIFSERTALAP